MDSPTSITDQTPKEKPVVITSSNNKKPMFKFSFVNPKILGAMTVLLLLIGGVGAGVYLTQSPQQTTTQASLPAVDLTFKPETLEANQNSEFSLDVYADARDNQITSTDLSINYDPAVLTLKSVSPGQFLPKILIPPEIGSGTAFVSLGTDGNSGASGNGIIASLIFEVSGTTSESSSQITFDPEKTKIQVLNRSAESANDTFGSSRVNIKAASQESETPQASASTAPEVKNDEAPIASDSAVDTNQTPEVSDFNGDGLTNTIDLSIMYSGWGDPETDVQRKADLNKDGKINGIDYSQFLPKFKL